MLTYRQMFCDIEQRDPSWQSQCVDGEHTPSDLLWCGVVLERHTGPSGPAAYGLRPVGWESIVEKARRDLDRIQAAWRVRHLVAACGQEEVRTFLEAIECEL